MTKFSFSPLTVGDHLVAVSTEGSSADTLATVGAEGKAAAPCGGNWEYQANIEQKSFQKENFKQNYLHASIWRILKRSGISDSTTAIRDAFIFAD